MTINEFYANQIISFVSKYSPELIKKANGNKNLIRQYILKHLEYKTIEVFFDKGEVIAVANYDVNELTARVKHCVIRPEYRNKNILQQLTATALRKWPFLQYIEFERPLKNKKQYRKISIYQLLRIKNGVTSLSARHTESASA